MHFFITVIMKVVWEGLPIKHLLAHPAHRYFLTLSYFALPKTFLFNNNIHRLFFTEANCSKFY